MSGPGTHGRSPWRTVRHGDSHVTMIARPAGRVKMGGPLAAQRDALLTFAPDPQARSSLRPTGSNRDPGPSRRSTGSCLPAPGRRAVAGPRLYHETLHAEVSGDQALKSRARP